MLQFQQQLFFPIGLRNRGIPIRYTSLFCQWGRWVTNIDGDSELTFPTAFPSACCSIVGTYNVDNTGDQYTHSMKIRTYSTSKFKAYHNAPTTFWMAIGY